MNNNNYTGTLGQRVRLSIRTKQYDQGMAGLFDKLILDHLLRDLKNMSEQGFDDTDEFDDEFDPDDDFYDDPFDFSDRNDDNGIELTTEAEYTDDGKRIEIKYNETELTGMDGAVTCISFAKNAPGIISMLRGGSVYTVMIFEEAKRHICAYETPIMPFELCILTRKVANRIDGTSGSLDIDYLIEIRGAGTERTIFHMDLSPIDGQSISESDEKIDYIQDFPF